MAKRIHLFSYEAVGGDHAACGQYEPEAMTGKLDDVTCTACKRTNEFRIARAPNSRRSHAHTDYRRNAPA